MRNFEEVGCVGGIPASNNKDEVKSERVGILYEFVDCVLTLL